MHIRQHALQRALGRWLWCGVWLVASACQPDPPELGSYAYERRGVDCAPGTRPGLAGVRDDERSARGIGYSVRTPVNYDPRVAHPLLMVYAPAGVNRFGSESLTSLTKAATRAGFITAYANRRRLSIDVIEELGTIPGLIAEKWCVDPEQIFLTGHSDGGTVAVALAVLEQTQHIPTAIAPSAAGFTAQDLAAFVCPAPLSVMVMHSAEDRHFPGYGRQIADWWAACNRCEKRASPRRADGCRSYPNCADGVKTLYCEGTGSHLEWPGLNPQLLAFFAGLGRYSP